MSRGVVDVIIPAWNEEATIKNIVETFLRCHFVRTVHVIVDQKTDDGTADIVYKLKYESARRRLNIILSPHHGKGQAVKNALSYVNSNRVFLCDADLTGLTHEHIHLLVLSHGHTIGVPDIPDIPEGSSFPRNREAFYESWPLISGERVLPTSIVARTRLHGYLMETQINKACMDADIPLHVIPLVGLSSPLRFTPVRLQEMERDRMWGRERGILLP